MILNNLKASLLAVLFALGLNTIAQSMDQQSPIESRVLTRTVGSRVDVCQHLPIHYNDDSLFEISSTDRGKRGNNHSKGVTGLSVEQLIEDHVRNFYSSSIDLRIEAQKALFKYLMGNKEEAVLIAAAKIAEIIIKSNETASASEPITPSLADEQAITLIIKNLGKFSHLKSARLTFLKLHKYSTEEQKTAISNLLSRYCANCKNFY